MRPIYEALGRVAACAIAAGDNIRETHYLADEYPTDLGFSIFNGVQSVMFVAQPHHQRLTVISQHRLSAFDNYPIDGYVDEPEGTDKLREVVDGYPLEKYHVRAKIFSPEEDDNRYFDGVELRGHLYAFDDQFRMKEYEEISRDFQRYTPAVFDETLEELGYPQSAFDSEGAAQSGELQNPLDDSPAFQ